MPSPLASISVGSITAPATAVTAGTPSNGAGLDAGTHTYYPVFRTASGATTAGPASNTVTAVAADSNPSAIGAGFNLNNNSFGTALPDGYRNYAYTFRRLSDGAETALSPLSYASSAVGGGDFNRFQLSGLSSAPTGYVRQWYRTATVASFGSLPTASSSFKRIPVGATYSDGFSSHTSGMEDAASGFFWDGSSDASLGATAPSSNGTAKGVCAVTGIPLGPALCTFVDMYREFNGAGAATAKLAFSVANGTTGASDSTANSGLGATVPSSNTAAAARVAVTVPQGPTGTTDIEVFRTAIGSSQLKKSFAVGSNTAGTYTDSAADAALTTNAPTVDDSGLSQPR